MFLSWLPKFIWNTASTLHTQNSLRGFLWQCVWIIKTWKTLEIFDMNSWKEVLLTKIQWVWFMQEGVIATKQWKGYFSRWAQVRSLLTFHCLNSQCWSLLVTLTYRPTLALSSEKNNNNHNLASCKSWCQQRSSGPSQLCRRAWFNPLYTQTLQVSSPNNT